MGLFTRLALRLAGLQNHCGLLPGAALIAPCPGYRFPAVCGLVARTDAQHRLREIQPLCALLPGAALMAPCPGFGFPAVCGSGSPDRCAASPPGNVPKLMLPGLRCV